MLFRSGFAIGFDRLVEVMEQIDKAPADKGIDLFIISLGNKAMKRGYLWSCELNQAGIRTEIDFRGKSLKALMKRANKLNAGHVLIVGENELDQNSAILRNMNTKDQVSIDIDTLVDDLLEKLIK